MFERSGQPGLFCMLSKKMKGLDSGLVTDGGCAVNEGRIQ